MQDDHIGRFLAVAKSKSDLHAAIDALPDDAHLILVANACRCGDPGHAADTGTLVYHAVYGEPSAVEAVGLPRLAEHVIVTAGAV